MQTGRELKQVTKESTAVTLLETTEKYLFCAPAVCLGLHKFASCQFTNSLLEVAKLTMSFSYLAANGRVKFFVKHEFSVSCFLQQDRTGQNFVADFNQSFWQ